MIIYNSTWSLLFQWIRVILLVFVINLITQTEENYRHGRRLKFNGTVLSHRVTYKNCLLYLAIEYKNVHFNQKLICLYHFESCILTNVCLKLMKGKT